MRISSSLVRRADKIADSGVQIGHPLLLFPLPLPPSNSGRSFQRGGALPSSPVPLGVGFQRRGPRPPAFVSFQGVRGEIEIPPRFSLGGPGGTFSFEREYPPWLPHPLVRGASAGNPGPLREQRKRKGHSRTETVHYQKHPCEILRSMV